jgi:hypothetical protein
MKLPARTAGSGSPSLTSGKAVSSLLSVAPAVRIKYTE